MTENALTHLQNTVEFKELEHKGAERGEIAGKCIE